MHSGSILRGLTPADDKLRTIVHGNVGGETIMPASSPKISVVIPVYNSADSLRILMSRLLHVSEEMNQDFEIVLVDDCSVDNSWEVLTELKVQHGSILKIATLLKNSGQHNAILCGLSLSTGQVVVTMDDDLQNPPEEIPKLVDAIERGYDLAIGAYDSKKHTGVRNACGNLIDSVQRRIFQLPRDFQLTSFRAIRRIIVKNVCQMGGVFPYVTAMLLSQTSKYTNVDVRHDPRIFGRSNYSVKRCFLLAANLILNYSAFPVYVVAIACLAAVVFSVVYGASIISNVIFHGTSVPGWASTVVITSFFNAVVLLCLLIFALYISRFNQQLTRTRVNYAIRDLHE